MDGIIHTIIAFANTAGGKVLIGVRDKTKEIVGLQDPVEEEMRLANAIADSIELLFNPDIHVVSWRNKEFLLIQVPHSVGPYYAKSKGLKKAIYIRLGSTNRLADAAIICGQSYRGLYWAFQQISSISGAIICLILRNIQYSKLMPKSSANTSKKSYGQVCKTFQRRCFKCLSVEKEFWDSKSESQKNAKRT